MKKLLLLAFCLLAFPAFGQTLASPGGGSSATFPTICPAPVASGQILYDNAGACGGITGWTTNGTTTITGAASTTLAIGGATIGTNALAVTGTASISGVVAVSAGAVGAPAINFGGNATTGIYSPASGFVSFSGAGTLFAGVDATSIAGVAGSFTLYNGKPLAFSSNTSVGDVTLFRDAANTLAQRNGVNAQAFNLYGSFTDVSNKDYLAISKAAGGDATIATQGAGTGTGGSLQFSVPVAAGAGVAATAIAKFNGGTGHLLWNTDNTHDIGASGATRPRTGYFGTNVIAGNVVQGASISVNGNTSLTTSTQGNLLIRDANTGTTFGIMQLGGTTASFPAEKRVGATIAFRLADDSADAGITMSTIVASGITQITNATDSTTTTSGSLQVAGGAAIIKRVFIPGITASAGLQTAVLCQSSGGEMIADSVACLASSARFKNLAGPMEDGALFKLAALPMRRWNYKPEGIFHNDIEHVGPIAEDVATMDPRLAGYDKDGNVRTYSTEQLLAYTIKALQELKADNDNLRQEMKRIAR